MCEPVLVPYSGEAGETISLGEENKTVGEE